MGIDVRPRCPGTTRILLPANDSFARTEMCSQLPQKITFAASWTMRGPAEVVGVPNAESFVRVGSVHGVVALVHVRSTFERLNTLKASAMSWSVAGPIGMSFVMRGSTEKNVG